MNKIRTKFLLIIAGFSILLSVFLIARNCTSNIDRLQSQINLQTELALEFDLAIREYVAETVRPFAADHVGEDEFIPETMSTSFVARSVFEKVRNRFPDYVIKFSSDDPRNPANQANEAELEIIERFNQNPAMQRWSGEIEMDEGTYYALFSARRMKESCLRCHGVSQDAPESLIRQYGATAGFNRPMGEIIAIDTVAIPIEKYKAMIWKRSIADSCFIVFGLCFLFIGIFWLFSHLVSKRLSVISQHFRTAAEQNDLAAIHLIETDSSDEIGTMEKSFNFLASRLRSIYDSLEGLVDEKTAILQEVNHDLQNEVEVRKATEKALKETQQKLLLHIRQTPLGGIEWDVNFRVTSWNPAAETIFGYSSDEAVGRMASELILSKKDMPHTDKVWSDLLKQKGGTKSTNENVRKGGEVIVCQWYNTPLIDDAGNVIAVASFVQDITRQKEHEGQLKEAKLAAEAANQTKSEFLANMSHEIRTPMNSIIGFSDLLCDELLTEDQKSYVETIGNSGKNLLHIINDILDYSKIEAGDMTVDIISCSLSEILNDVYSLMEFSVAEKGLGFKVHDLLDRQDKIVTDPVRLKQCLVNLVGNAVKFTETGHIAIHVTVESSCLKFEVEDTGIGIPIDKQSSIFKAFKQADGSTTRKYGGTGLGLSITQKLVRLLGGEISVKSEPDKGAVFSFTLPKHVGQCGSEECCNDRTTFQVL